VGCRSHGPDPPSRRDPLAADVAGYSRLMGADEEGTHERLRARRRELVDPKIGEHHGRIAFVSLPVARLDRLLHFFERNRSLTRALERAARTFDVVPRRRGDQLDPPILEQRDADLIAGRHPEMVQHRSPQRNLPFRRDRQFERHRQTRPDMFASTS
jgi:hypothetical protein